MKIKEHIVMCIFLFTAKNLDCGRAKQLIESIINEFNLARDEKTFEQLFQTIIDFCQKNNINLDEKPTQHRKRAVSTRY